MLNECMPEVRQFAEAVLAGHPEPLARATRVAYAAGAEVPELLRALEAIRPANGNGPMLLAQARASVQDWQWIADRRRALA